MHISAACLCFEQPTVDLSVQEVLKVLQIASNGIPICTDLHLVPDLSQRVVGLLTGCIELVCFRESVLVVILQLLYHALISSVRHLKHRETSAQRSAAMAVAVAVASCSVVTAASSAVSVPGPR